MGVEKEMSEKSEDTVYRAFLKRYDRVYNPEANDKATLEKIERLERLKRQSAASKGGTRHGR
jgi:hypothetical protein